MTAKQAFESIMRIDGHTNFKMKDNKYLNASMQVRWRWFLTGWEMRGFK